MWPIVIIDVRRGSESRLGYQFLRGIVADADDTAENDGYLDYTEPYDTNYEEVLGATHCEVAHFFCCCK